MPFSELVADRDCCSRSDWGMACSPLPAGPLMVSSVEVAALGLDIGGAWDVPAAAGNTGCGSWRLLAGVCSPSELVGPAWISLYLKKKKKDLYLGCCC